MKKTSLLVSALIIGLFLFQADQNPDSSSWELLKELVLIPGVSGYEGPVADFIQSRLPEGVDPQRDEIDNIWFTVGAGTPHLVFVAHTDELGLVVEKITAEGTCTVTGRGGFFPQMYEGRPVVVHSEKGPVPGIVAPREDYLRGASVEKTFALEDIRIDLGAVDEEKARGLGVAEGDSVTIRKRITTLGEDLIAVRAVDDRAGCAALLAAAHRIDWTQIQAKRITFAWDVQEEIGLIGASRLAKTLQADYVFPVDTFVSSDGPFDSKRFAHLPLGRGAVLRAIDSSSIAPRTALEKVRRIADNQGIPVQWGNTWGGNDGSVFVPWGAVDMPLSWPGVYSHSFIEKIHRSDLEALTGLIIALVEDW